MCKIIMVACDLHDRSMLLKIAVGRGPAEKRQWDNTPTARKALIDWLRERAQVAGGARVIFAYEASGLGFGLYDELTAAGFECHVLAPTKMTPSPAQRRRKTDEKDADNILDLLRGHVLAGNRLPTVWIPDPQTRDDRELVRARCDLSHKVSLLKSQLKCLLKRNKLSRPADLGQGWTAKYRKWLEELTAEPSPLGASSRLALGSLWRQLEYVEEEEWRLNLQLKKLSRSPRYKTAVVELMKLQGVGLLTALVFLTEVGDLNRFANRRQIAAYLGLAPASYESGQRGDCKGHITHQGPSRVRRVLCQAIWARVRQENPEQAAYQRVVAKNPKHKKIAVVAGMRRLAIRMWHIGRQAQAVDRPVAVPWGRDQRPQFPPPDPHPLPSSLLFRPAEQSVGTATTG